MRVLHLPHGYWPATGGAERLAEGWSEGLAARGHDVQVSVADLATPEGLYRFGIPPTGRESESLNGVAIHRIGLGTTYRLGGTIFRSDPYAPGVAGDRIRRSIRTHLTSTLRDEIEQFKPDVVLTLPHLFENVRIVFELQRDFRFPLVWAPMLHETDPNWPFDEVRDMAGRADAILAMTSFEADRLATAYGADSDRVHVVAPGVDVPDVLPYPVDGPPTVIYLGRLSRSKGLDVLPATMTEIWNHVPEARLVVAGATTPDAPFIRAAFSEIRLPSEHAVEFHEDISEEDKQRLLSNATVLVLPSDRESFGIVLLEAWALATPVIAADSPVIRSTVRDGIDGFLFPAGDATALASTLKACLEDTERSRSLGLAGYERVRSEYSWSVAAERLETVCEQAIARPSQDPS